MNLSKSKNMRDILFLVIFYASIMYVLSEVEIWNFEKSSIDLLSISDSYEYIIYDETKDKFHLKLTKYISKKNGEITNINYIQKNNEEKHEIEWENIYNFYNLETNKYICPKGKNYLVDYSSNIIEEIKYPINGIVGNWEFTCYYTNNRLFISYLSSTDKNIYVLNKNNGYSWEDLPMHSGYFDILWPSQEINKEEAYIVAILLEGNNIQLVKIKMSITDSMTKTSMNEILHISKSLNKSYAFFDENKYFYWITYNDTKMLSGYSTTPIPVDLDNEVLNNNIKRINNNISLFDSLENLKINYLYFIRNTKYVYYEIESNKIIYHGIIDIKLNKIIFNTNVVINYYNPISKYSLLAITNSSAYKICINSIYNGDCKDECPPNQTLVIDSENGNHCEGIEICQNYIFKPNNTCTDECDIKFNIVANGKECGLCKYLNNSFPYKIINEIICIKEKPNNTYFIDEESYILDYCDSSCETCYGKEEDKCLSCDNSFLFNNKCLSKCPDGYYGDLFKKQCFECNSNCLTCTQASKNGNNFCSSCNPNTNDSYLIVADGMNQNCVNECPENTILNNDTKQCVNKKFDDSHDKGNENKNNYTWLLILIIILIVIILIIVIFIIYKKYNKKNDFDSDTLLNDISSFSEETED